MQLLQDTFIIEQLQIIDESKTNGPMKIRGVFGRCNEKNNNGRIYPTAVLVSQLEKVKPLIAERRLCGELDHPQNDTVRLANASHLITKLDLKGDDLIGEAEILKTPAGLTAKALVEGGVRIGISSRGMGTLSEDQNGDKIVNEDFRLITFDLVADPSTRGAYPSLAESTESKFVRESQSKLKKESNFVTMLASKMRDAYQPWIEEDSKKGYPGIKGGTKAASAKEKTLQDKIGDLKKKRAKYPLIRKSQTVSDAFELVKADGIWHRIAEALLGEDFAAGVRKAKERSSDERRNRALERLRREQLKPKLTKGIGTPKSRKEARKAGKSAKKEESREDSGTAYRQIGSILMEAFSDGEEEQLRKQVTTNQPRGEGFAARALRHSSERRHTRLTQIAKAKGKQQGKTAAEVAKLKGVTKVRRVIGQQRSRQAFEKGEQRRTGHMGVGGEVRHGLRRFGQALTGGGLKTVQQTDKDRKIIDVKHHPVKKSPDAQEKTSTTPKPTNPKAPQGHWTGDKTRDPDTTRWNRSERGGGELFPKEETPAETKVRIKAHQEKRGVSVVKGSKGTGADEPVSPRLTRAGYKRGPDGRLVKEAYKQIGRMLAEMFDLVEKKNWIQKAEKSIDRRGTEGKCTPITKPGCTGRAKALAKTFKKMAKRRKDESTSPLYTQGPQERAETTRRYKLKQSRLPKHKQFQAGKSQAQKDTENRETNTGLVQSGRRL